MIIFRKKYEEACASGVSGTGAAEELAVQIKEAEALVERSEQGVMSSRSPITIVEKVQISDTTKLVKKLIIDISKDIEKGRPTDSNREKLDKAVSALKTSIENIL
ncbi:MAG: hypothetical protein IKP31_02975 [Lachnospiraceae bacterium]|nr:hypothetical protein [Lachnospiraceae bacterium]